MKRPLAPAASAPRARYPRLALGWRILVAASPLVGAVGVVHGDATVPTPSRPGEPSQRGGAQKPADKPKPDVKRLGGKIAMPHHDKISLRMHLHPHDPGAPCFTDDDEAA